MYIAYATVQFDTSCFLLCLIVFPGSIETRILRSSQSLTTTAESHWSTETTVADIVQGTVCCDAGAIGETGSKDFRRVAIFSTIRQVEVGHPRFIQLALGHDVEHGHFFAIVDTSHLGVVALLLVRLDTVDHIHGQVLHRHIFVALEEVLTIDQEFLDFLTIPRNLAIVADFDTG